MRQTTIPRQRQRGGTMIEVLIAILIFSFAVLGLIGLQTNATYSTTEAKYRTEAGLIAQQRISEMWVNQGGVGRPNLANYVTPNTGIDISASSGLPNGRLFTERGTPECNNDPSCFIVTVIWQQPQDPNGQPSPVHNVVVIAHITNNN